jgi:hypothetical protein
MQVPHNFININLICGFSKCGKDTVAKMFDEQYKYIHYKISNFSKENKNVEVDYNTTSVQKYKQLFPYLNNISIVYNLLQHIEKEYINKPITNIVNIVISDLRFINEYNAFLYFFERFSGSLKINLIKLTRKDSLRYYSVDKKSFDTDHLNFSYNYIIENNSDIQSLESKMKILHNHIQNDRLEPRRINMIIEADL